MAKRKSESVIALEIEKYKKKIHEFQRYLETSNFQTAGDDKYKEADLHIKLMSALPNWILALKQMEEDSQDKAMELRGGAEMSDAARLLLEENNE